MKLGDFLNSQAAKVGLQNDPALIALLSNSEFANREIDDKFANAVNEGLMSFDSAKNNYNLKTHYSATILNAVDAKLLENIEKLDLDEEILSKIKEEKNSYNKIQLVKDAVVGNLEKLKATGGPESKTQKAEMEKQIKDLNDQLFGLKEQHKKDKSDWQSQYDNQIKDFLFTNYLASKNYANSDYSSDENSAFARMLIEKALKESGAVIVKDGEKLALKQAGSPELDYYDKDNKKVSFNDFSDSILASKKVLAVTKSGGESPKTPQPHQDVILGGGKTTMFNDAIQNSLNDLKQEQ